MKIYLEQESLYEAAKTMHEEDKFTYEGWKYLEEILSRTCNNTYTYSKNDPLMASFEEVAVEDLVDWHLVTARPADVLSWLSKECTKWLVGIYPVARTSGEAVEWQLYAMVKKDMHPEAVDLMDAMPQEMFLKTFSMKEYLLGTVEFDMERIDTAKLRDALYANASGEIVSHRIPDDVTVDMREYMEGPVFGNAKVMMACLGKGDPSEENNN